MTADDRQPILRNAELSDAAAVADTITSAFREDPLWSQVFGLTTSAAAPAAPSPAAASSLSRAELLERYRTWWRLFVDGALENGRIWVSDGCEAAAVWLPPGGVELGPRQEVGVEALLAGMTAPEQAVVRELGTLFEAARPAEPHYYLTLLGTHQDHQRQGIGWALLDRSLAWVDACGGAAYLESTNPVNLERYRAAGFEPLGGFAAEGAPRVMTMWRKPRAPR